ncbi:4'-phosphopantetheinyl transferase [Streptomyces sp. NPDC050504]|uniref:4'-phosphopantetheinyl transferase n=1 Tax=Streptomyces sp. NPDC050504 TaxID=3365618 RepID=UPI0037974AAE
MTGGGMTGDMTGDGLTGDMTGDGLTGGGTVDGGAARGRTGGEGPQAAASPLIRAILPPSVTCAEATADVVDVVLPAEEQALVARSVDSRRAEFTTGRTCARRALADLGVTAGPILSDARGAPQWPNGTIGSITHCDGYRAAVAARTADVVTLGIDAEANQPLPEGILEAVALPAEREWVRALLRARPEVHWDRLLFSMKETVYKAWYPLARCMLDFDEAHLAVDPDQHTFTARLLRPGPEVSGRPVTGFSGRWTATEALVLSAIAVPNDSRWSRTAPVS